jgi:hypothetical protein
MSFVICTPQLILLRRQKVQFSDTGGGGMSADGEIRNRYQFRTIILKINLNET